MSNHSKNSPIQLKVQVWIYYFDPALGRYQFLTLLTTQGRGGFWQPVTGSVEPHEGLSEAALREAREETGLLFQSEPRALEGSFEFQSRWGGLVQEHSFMLEVYPEPVGGVPQVLLDAHEHVNYQWRGFQETLALLKYASNQEKLAQVVQYLNNQSSKKQG